MRPKKQSKARTTKSKNPWRDFLPADSNRRVYFKIREAIIHKWDQVVELVQRRPSTAPAAKALAQNALSLMKEADELLDWILPSGVPLSPEEIVKTISSMEQVGFDVKSRAEFLKIARRSKKGAPPKMREQTIRALEMRLADRSWGSLTRALCKCGLPNHNLYCQDRIKKQVRRLKKLLDKYEISIR